MQYEGAGGHLETPELRVMEQPILLQKKYHFCKFCVIFANDIWQPSVLTQQLFTTPILLSKVFSRYTVNGNIHRLALHALTAVITLRKNLNLTNPNPKCTKYSTTCVTPEWPLTQSGISCQSGILSLIHGNVIILFWRWVCLKLSDVNDDSNCDW